MGAAREVPKAIAAFNAGGNFNPHSNVFVHREFYLMRLYDVAESLGQAQFEQFAPGVWDSLLAVYRMTFSTKIAKAQPGMNLEEIPEDPGDLYGGNRA